MFAALCSWPYSFTYRDIARMTPRQVFALLDQLRAADKIAGADSPPPADQPEPPTDGKQQWLQTFGLDQFECWKPYPGEKDDDPFSLPREIARERLYTSICRLCEMGMLQDKGIPQGNMEAARDFFDLQWQMNCEKFERLQKERDDALQRETDGRPGADPG